MSAQTIDAEVRRLAQLPALEYERVRKEEAKHLGVRAAALDSAVERARGNNTDAVAGQALTFPEIERWPEPVNGPDVLDEIAAACDRFLQLPEHGKTVVALWVTLTYVADAFDHLPMLFITAPEKGCGKSTVLDLVGRLCARPLSASNITSSALFRTVELACPTLLLDEVDTFVGTNEEMRGILNSGHERGGGVIRGVGDAHEPRRFSTYCPKALAGIGRLPGTIEDRCLILAMQRAAPDEHVEKLRRAIQFPDLQRKLARWAEDNLEALRNSRPAMPDHLHNRAADNWEPLFAIAAQVGSQWPGLLASAAARLAGNGAATESVGVELLKEIRAAFDARGPRIKTQQLIDFLCADEAARWADYDNGRPIKPPQLARLLKRYGIGPQTVRAASGDEPGKGYKREQFAEVFRRYLPSHAQQSARAAGTTTQINNDVDLASNSSRYTGEHVTAPDGSQVLDPSTVVPL